MSYYNDNDPAIAEWLRSLIKAGLIPQGFVDDRDIKEVEPENLKDYEQLHFFAGIGGWPYALQLAEWSGPVWTASLPCQPFSSAGKRLAERDERHLWPAFRRLVALCRPATIFGEQVASKTGRKWLSGVRADLEALGYAVGSADLCAAGVGAPHIRQRLFWVADRFQSRLEGHAGNGSGGHESRRIDQETSRPTAEGGESGGMADTEMSKRRRSGRAKDAGRGIAKAGGSGVDSRVVQPNRSRSQSRDSTIEVARYGNTPISTNIWDQSIMWLCSDGRWRRIPARTHKLSRAAATSSRADQEREIRLPEPAFFPLAHGVSGRVAKLRGLGNAIVPQLAAEFVKAYMEIVRMR